MEKEKARSRDRSVLKLSFLVILCFFLVCAYGGWGRRQPEGLYVPSGLLRSLCRLLRAYTLVGPPIGERERKKRQREVRRTGNVPTMHVEAADGSRYSFVTRISASRFVAKIPSRSLRVGDARTDKRRVILRGKGVKRFALLPHVVRDAVQEPPQSARRGRYGSVHGAEDAELGCFNVLHDGQIKMDSHIHSHSHRRCGRFVLFPGIRQQAAIRGSERTPQRSGGH